MTEQNIAEVGNEIQLSQHPDAAEVAASEEAENQAPEPAPKKLPPKTMVSTTVVDKYTVPPREVGPGDGPGGRVQRRELKPEHQSLPQYLAEAFNNPNKARWKVEVHRMSPARWNGVTFPCERMETINVMPFPEIVDRVTQLFGGGRYNIKVIDDSLRCVNACPFEIDPEQCPPIPKIDPNNPATAVAIPGAPAISANPIARGAMEEATVAQQIRTENAEYQLEKNRKAREAEKEAEEERKQARMQNTQMQPMMLLMQQMQQAQQQAAQRQAEEMRAFMATIADKLTAPKADQTLTMLPLIMETIKSNTAQTIEMIKAQSNKPTNNEAIETAKMMVQQQQANMDAMMKMALGGNAKSDALVDKLFTAAMTNNKENSVQNALKLLEQGRNETIRMLELKQELGSPENEPEQPGWLGTILQLMNSPQGAGLMGALAQLLMRSKAENKPVTAPQVAQVIQQAHVSGPGVPQQQMIQQPMLPMPQQKQPQFQGGYPQPQAPVPPMNTLMARSPMQPLGQPAPVQQAVQMAPVAPPAPPQLPVGISGVADGVAAPGTEPTAEPMPVAQPSHNVIQIPQMPVQQGPSILTINTPVGQVQMTDEDRGYLNDIIVQATSDTQAGRRSHSWPQYALDKLPRAFLAALAATRTDFAAQFNILQQAADPALFAQFQTVLLAPDHAQDFASFQGGLNLLVQAQSTGSSVIME